MNVTTGEALFVFDETMNVRSWNKAAEELTGIPAEEAIGRPCWDVLHGTDERGALVCHAGCSNARLVREGWPVHSHEVVIRTKDGGRRVALSTIAVSDADAKLFLHVLRDLSAPAAEPEPSAFSLTRRQLEVLALLADGLAAKTIAERLQIAVPTVRNHIRAILVEFDAHSQLEAVARAREAGLLRR